MFLHVYLLPQKRACTSLKKTPEEKKDIDFFFQHTKKFISFCQNVNCASTESIETGLGKTGGESVELFRFCTVISVNKLSKTRKCLNLEDILQV